MRRRLLLLAAALPALACVASARAQTGDIRVHDPVIIRADDVYYIFSTGRGIPIRRSADLVHWESAGRVFEEMPDWMPEVVPEARGSLWAPDISFFNGRYHLYYSVSSFGSQRSAIGLATNRTLDPANPEYRWEDHGPVIRSLPGVSTHNAIDPNVALGIANSLWLRAGVDFHDEYLTTVRDHFDATAETLDFDDPEVVRVARAYVEGGFAAVRAFGPASVPRLDEVGLNLPVLAYAIGISLLSGLLFGLAPAMRAWKPDLAPALGEGRTSTAGRTHLRLRGLLVVAEVAVAVVLVVGAGLLIQSFARLAGTPPGFAPQNVLTFNVALPVATYDTWDRTIGFYDRLLERLAALPGAIAVGTTTTLPLREELDYRLPVSVAGQPPSPNPSDSEAWYRMVSAGYFRAMRVPLVQGRFFTEADGPESPGVVIVNEAFVKRYLAGVDPLGHALQAISGGFGPLGRILVQRPAIVGVVGDVKQAGLASGTEPAVYYHARQAPFRSTIVVVRTHGDPRATIPDVRAQLHAVDPALPMAHVATLEQNVSNAVAQPRFQTLLLGAFAGLALLLGAVGLYGILSHSVLRRTREIGIRLALGGAPGDIRRMVMGEGLRLVAAGVALGLALALAVTRYLETLLYGVDARDPLTFSAVPLVLAATALLASYLPVRRATRIDPVTALRE